MPSFVKDMPVAEFRDKFGGDVNVAVQSREENSEPSTGVVEETPQQKIRGE